MILLWPGVSKKFSCYTKNRSLQFDFAMWQLFCKVTWQVTMANFQMTDGIFWSVYGQWWLPWFFPREMSIHHMPSISLMLTANGTRQCGWSSFDSLLIRCQVNTLVYVSKVLTTKLSVRQLDIHSNNANSALFCRCKNLYLALRIKIDSNWVSVYVSTYLLCLST